MNDPHVVSLIYKIVKSEGLEFDDPQDIELNTPDFKLKLSNGILTLEPLQHFSSIEQVLPIANEFVHAWEISAGLEYNSPEFQLSYKDSEVVDRNPKRNSPTSKLNIGITATASLSDTLIKNTYPRPPVNFHFNQDIETLWLRYSGYLENKEPLLGMVYNCLTYIENVMNNDGTRKAASKALSIDYAILDKIGLLSSKRGDVLTARKVTTDLKPFVGKEKQWLESVIPVIIKHLATHKPGDILKMSDLPVQL